MTKIIAAMTSALMTLTILTSFGNEKNTVDNLCLFDFFTSSPAIEFVEDKTDEEGTQTSNEKGKFKVRLKFLDIILSVFEDN